MQQTINHWLKITFILIFIMGIAGIVSGQEPVTWDTVTILESGDVLSDTIDEDINAHLYAFQASAGDIVTIQMVQDDDNLDPFLVLMTTEGEVLAIDDDSGTTFLSAIITEFEIPDDGTYLIIATGLTYLDGTDTPFDTAGYRIALAGNTPTDNADEIEVVAEVLNYGDVVRADSTDDNPAVFFVFDGQAGDVVDVMVQSNEFPTIIHIFDPDGAHIGVDPSAVTGLELPDDGVYLILATDAFFYDVLSDDTYFIGGNFVISLDG